MLVNQQTNLPKDILFLWINIMLVRGKGGHLIEIKRENFNTDAEFYRAIASIKFTFIKKNPSVPIEERIANLVKRRVCM